MTDLVLLIIDIEIGMLFVVGTYAVWARLGGYPEAWYRIARIEYLVHHVFGPDRSDGRWVYKTTDIDTKTKPATLTKGGKVWQLNEEAMGRDTGRPSWWHNYDETEALPIFTWKEEAKMEPGIIAAAYENDCIERVHRLGQKGGIPGWFWVLLVVAIVLVVVIMSSYFNYNTYCAVKPTSCGNGGVRIG